MANTWYISLALIFLLFASIPSISSDKSPAFFFLEHLQGCTKGETVKGIHQLKEYMMRFGYMNSNPNTTLGDDDDFNDLLEDAIKMYQLNFNLNVTGNLDAPTLKKMITPRCGVPDIINGTNYMDYHGKHGSGPKGVHAHLHYSFFPNSPRWPPSKSHLTYVFLNNGQALSSIVAASFVRWSSVSHFTFEETLDVDSADIKIGAFVGSHGDSRSFDGPGGVLAHAFAPVVGHFHIDADEIWSLTIPSLDEMDLESVCVHEIGHLLGLDHSSVEEAIMYPSISSGQVKRELHADDINGIQALYNL